MSTTLDLSGLAARASVEGRSWASVNAALLDFLGAAYEETVRRALEHLGEYALMLRVLGSYPRHK